MTDIAANTSTSATINLGGTVQDNLEVTGDHDWFRLNLAAGQEVSITLNGISLTDPFVNIRDGAGNILYKNDDGGPGLDSLLSFKAGAGGTYFIDVGSAQDNQTGAYQLTVSPYTLPPVASMDQIANWLTHGYWDGDAHHFDVTQGRTITVNFGAIPADSANVARAALDVWSDALGIHFQEVSSGAQIVFNDASTGTGAFSDGVWANGITSSATVNVSSARLGSGPGIVRVGLQTYIHEIGHALGLGHAGDYNGGTAFSRYPYEALFLNDGAAVSVMSYFDNGESNYYAGRGFTNNLVVTPQLADIIAVGNLYGLSSTTRTGNTTYGFHDTSGREVFDASLHPNVAYTLFDSGGIDTLDYSGFSANQLISLVAETFSNVGSGVGNVVIARGTLIENAVGGSGNDTIVGNDASNRLDGSAGADTLKGGAGNDVYVVDHVGDKIEELAGGGTDRVECVVSYTLSDQVEYLTLTGAGAINGTGNAMANVLTGNSAANTLDGQAGNDTMDGAGGGDTLRGGAGNDIYVIDADDTVTELAGDGADLVRAGFTYVLGANLESLILTGTSAINGSGNGLANVITGNDATNQLSGGGADDRIESNGGNDRLDGGAGADVMYGGAGDDTYVRDNSADVIVEGIGEGTDLVLASVTTTLGANLEKLTLTDSGAINGVGNGLANLLTGNAAANQLNGGSGDDRLLGNGGNDLLDGGAGVDVMYGGAGNDTYVRDNPGDTLVEAVVGGIDLVLAAITTALGANVENLTLTGAASANGTGNDLANGLVGNNVANQLFGNGGDDRLFGNGGNDTLDGGAGADVMYGGSGDDTYIRDNAGDAIVETSGQGSDLVVSSVTTRLGANIENLTLTGSSAIDGTGNAEANRLTGSGAANALAGGDGDDQLIGNAGDDVLDGGAGNDSLVGGEGNDRLYGGTGGNYMVGGNGADIFYFGVNGSGFMDALPDTIHDFSHSASDRINLASIDANMTVSGDQAFHFVGAGAFDGNPGALRYEQKDGQTMLYGDTDGDKVADFLIRLDGLHDLVGGDFLL